MPKQVKWRDPRKNIYTITVTSKSMGFVAHIETHSNKKKAEERLSRLSALWVHQRDKREYEVEMHTTKLQRKSRWD